MYLALETSQLSKTKTLVALVAARPEDNYDRYENFDVDELVSNLRLLKSYAACFLGEGKCTAEGNDFKKWIPEAVQSNCGKCSDHQKHLVGKVIKACIDKLPEEWNKLNAIHNPDGKYDEKLKDLPGKIRKLNKMKFLVILALVALAAARPEANYEKYENFDVDELVSNLRLLKSYVACFIGEGKCTPEGSDFKEWIPEAVQSNCGKCSDNQKHLVGKVIKACMEKLPEEWKKLNALHNPDGKYDEGLKNFLDNYGH
ncbi:chemosensory protein precursor [Danaus plexippus plexippus]|uniref:Chemosensory protein n=2 Tax=Danaus plexippus TaxID=13037 RepID=A0A212FBG3_DANPL|nr:chemosensory protein precursor [Danaus plexippus plexippus]